VSLRGTLPIVLFGIVCSANACSSDASPDDESRFAVPARAGFEPVSDMLHGRCGSLDCHGHVARNLRLYGKDGLRLSPADRPGQDGGVTSANEHDQNYAAVIALEPEMLDRVVRAAGRAPERLTLLRKARNTEHHVGGRAVAPGSDADRCLTSWLAAETNAEACRRAAVFPRPVPR
jgi:hypothetical protein